MMPGLCYLSGSCFPSMRALACTVMTDSGMDGYDMGGLWNGRWASIGLQEQEWQYGGMAPRWCQLVDGTHSTTMA